MCGDFVEHALDVVANVSTHIVFVEPVGLALAALVVVWRISERLVEVERRRAALPDKET